MATTTPPSPVNITTVLHEDRLFPPPKSFSKTAWIKSMAEYKRLYDESVRQPEKFWARQAKEELVWFKPWTNGVAMEAAACQVVRRRAD